MKISSPQFEELYGLLNKEQRQAVDTIEGPVMVIAGPGTGKTQVVTLRIAKILLESDVEPENILALTFTESAAFEMKKRLRGIIGTAAYRVNICTFHSFCNEIILDYSEEFPEIIGSVNATQVDQMEIVAGIIRVTQFEHIKPFGDQLYYAKDALRAVSSLKRDGISSEEYARLAEEEEKEFLSRDDILGRTGEIKSALRADAKRLAKNKELGVLYASYEKRMREMRLYDYDDMILRVVSKLSSDKDFCSDIREKYLYVLADEHQDANNAQHKVLELLGGQDDQPNIFVVGDEKQAIFKFQGASLGNFAYFQNLYPSSKLVRLTVNYRSTQHILDVSSHLMNEDRCLLVSHGQMSGERVQTWMFSNEDAESSFVASEIRNLQNKGIGLERIAVLYRDNNDAPFVMRSLDASEIPYALESDQDALEDRGVRKLFLLAGAVERIGEDEFLYPALHADVLGIHLVDLHHLKEKAQFSKQSLWDALRRTAEDASFRVFGKEKFASVYHLLMGWSKFARNVAALPVLERILNESGLLGQLLQSAGSMESMGKIHRIFAEARSVAVSNKKPMLGDFLAHIDALSQHGISLEKRADTRTARGVRLMTAHRAKGREFDAVFIVRAVHRKWGGRRSAEKFRLPGTMRLVREDDEERRVFYVALTRAKAHAYVTCSLVGENGREQLPSRFTEELLPSLKQEGDAKAFEETLRGSFAVSKTQDNANEYEEQELIRNLFLVKGLSATSLNNYLACPWRFVYVNLLQIPKAKSVHQMFGTAVHKALEEFFRKYVEGETSKSLLLSAFERQLEISGIPPADWERMRQKGIHALSGYYDTYSSSWVQNTLSELKISDVELELPHAVQLRLTGKLDKVEFLGQGNEVNVVDYKTGKPKSRGVIQGTTQSSNGDYYRQLVFYQLLLDKHKDGAYRMVSGEIDFVEPNERGKYKKEGFVISSEEVEGLGEHIQHIAQEVLTLSFWESVCRDVDCEYCALRRLARGG